MKQLLLCFVFIMPATVALSQKETYDLVSYTPPAKWKKEAKENIISYTNTNKKNSTWCRIGIVKSTASKGSIEADFESEWQELVAKPYGTTDAPQANEVLDTAGWKIKAGVGKFSFNNRDAMALLTTMSGYNRCVSVVSLTNSQDYIKDIQSLLTSIDLKKMNIADQSPILNTGDNNTGIDTQNQTVPATTSNDLGPDNTQRKDGFAFSSTNFDDGWTSIVQEDWVQVSKRSIKVLLHYPKEGTIFPADPDVLTTAAWNILVAPRYSNLKNYKTAYIATYNRPYLGMGYATENKTGKEVFIVLFRQGEGWIEFIAPDKNTFIQEYKFDPETIKWDSNSDLMNPLANMAAHNKFAVAASDFKGKWTSDFTGIQQLYNVYTGDYAGMHMNQSNEEFIFGNGGNYSWKLLVVNGMAGNAKFTEVKSSGKLSVPNNWQVHFTKIETGSKTYNAFWTCIKGARILNLLDAQYPGSGIYTKYGLAK